jgi:hypothetical protein
LLMWTKGLYRIGMFPILIGGHPGNSGDNGPIPLCPSYVTHNNGFIIQIPGAPSRFWRSHFGTRVCVKST